MNQSTVQTKAAKNAEQKPQGQNQQDQSAPTPFLGSVNIQRDPAQTTPIHSSNFNEQ